MSHDNIFSDYSEYEVVDGSEGNDENNDWMDEDSLIDGSFLVKSKIKNKQIYVDVLSYLRKLTLYKCLSVNRTWCRIVTSILWRNLELFTCETNGMMIDELCCRYDSTHKYLYPIIKI